MRSESGVNESDNNYNASSSTNQNDATGSSVKSGSSIFGGFSSLNHEHDWLRLTHCYNPWLDAKLKIRIYTPGMINGHWEGRLLVRYNKVHLLIS